jgi:hypothetical protein
MKAVHIAPKSRELEIRAAEALRATLRQVSTIEIKEMKVETRGAGREIGILANVGVLGHDHILACKVAPSGAAGTARRALRELQEEAASLPENAMLVFIAPYLEPEARDLCRAARTGYVDLEENACLMMGEVFISKRSMPRRQPLAEQAPAQASETIMARKFPPSRVAAPAAVCGAEALSCA